MKKARNKRTNVLCVLPFLESTLFDIRLIQPLKKWAEKYDGNLRIELLHKVSESDAQWADVAVLSREANVYSEYCVNLMHCYSVPVVFDIDDLLTDVPPFLSVHEHCENNKELLVKMLTDVDVVTTTTDRIKQQLSRYADNVKVIGNCAAPALQGIRDFVKSKKVSLIVASSDTVRVDFIADALRDVVNHYADKTTEVEIIGIGPPGEWLKGKGLPVSVLPNMSYPEFRAFLEKIDNAIGIIPLDDSLFSSCKSPIKYIDYSFSGIPSICSNVPPYSDFILNDEAGILVGNDKEAWVNAIEGLVDDARKRYGIAKSAWNYCNNSSTLEHSAQQWEELIEYLCTDSVHVKPPVFDGKNTINSSGRLIPVLRLMFSANSYVKAYHELRKNGLGSLSRKVVRFISGHMVR